MEQTDPLIALPNSRSTETPKNRCELRHAVGREAEGRPELYQASWVLTDLGPLSHSDGGEGSWAGR
jgi:hypothetical protein